MHRQVQLQLELVLMGSSIPGPHSIVILSSSASFLARRAEAAPFIGEKSIFCFSPLFSASSRSSFVVGSSDSAPKSAGTRSASIPTHSHSVPRGKLHGLRAAQELKTSTTRGVLKHQLEHLKPNWGD